VAGCNAVNPRIGSGLKYIRRLQEEKAVEQVQNLKDGTRRSTRNASSEGNRETGDREVDSCSTNDGGAIFGKPQERQLSESSFNGRTTKASGKTARKDRGWLSQTIKGLGELLSVVAENQDVKIPRL